MKKIIRKIKQLQTKKSVKAFKIALCQNALEMPVIIISFNNGVYVESMVNQLQAFGIVPIILDNHSSNSETKMTLKMLEEKSMARVVYLEKNFGPMILFQQQFYDCLPNFFCCTDPDLLFSPSLPKNFLEQLKQLTIDFQVYKSGLALDLLKNEKTIPTITTVKRKRPIRYEKSYTVREWEAQFWAKKLEHSSLEVYAASLDTTLAVYNKNHYRGDFVDAVRVAGDFSAIHLPWFPALDIMGKDSKNCYATTSKFSSWIK